MLVKVYRGDRWRWKNGPSARSDLGGRHGGVFAPNECGRGGTLARLQSIRTMVIEPELRAHGGRLFKVMDDGLLVEFASAVRALECAQAI